MQKNKNEKIKASWRRPQYLFAVCLLNVLFPFTAHCQLTDLNRHSGIDIKKPAALNTVSILADNTETVLERDTIAAWTSLSGKNYNGTVYLNWDVANQRHDGLYIIYRSADGMNYEFIGKKEGTGVPISAEIAYYFQDESPLSGSVYYKVLYVANNKTFTLSKAIIVTE